MISPDMTEKLFLDMEASFGETFFGCLAGYITATKHGLTEMELLDIMSCNQQVRISYMKSDIGLATDSTS